MLNEMQSATSPVPFGSAVLRKHCLFVTCVTDSDLGWTVLCRSAFISL